MAQRNITPFPPPSDAAGDDLAALINEMIDARLRQLWPRLATVTNIRARPDGP